MTHLFKRISNSFQARQAERALRGLPDHILKDIGVSRGGIPRAVQDNRDA